MRPDINYGDALEFNADALFQFPPDRFAEAFRVHVQRFALLLGFPYPGRFLGVGYIDLSKTLAVVQPARLKSQFKKVAQSHTPGLGRHRIQVFTQRFIVKVDAAFLRQQSLCEGDNIRYGSFFEVALPIPVELHSGTGLIRRRNRSPMANCKIPRRSGCARRIIRSSRA